MRFAFLYVGLTISTFCVAQKNITGQVVSLISNKPVSNLRIGLNNKREVYSDANGHFTLKRRNKVLYGEPYYYIGRIDTLESTKKTLHLKLYVSLTVDSVVALCHISLNKIQLFCGGGLFNSGPGQNDSEFEKNYGVKFHYPGCVMPPPENLRSYNRVMAYYLDQNFGTEWRKKLPGRVWGLTDIYPGATR